jgi:hypothetical protein
MQLSYLSEIRFRKIEDKFKRYLKLNETSAWKEQFYCMASKKLQTVDIDQKIKFYTGPSK